MVKKAFPILILLILFWSCATYTPPPPSFYLENFPPSIVAKLSLEERILAEDAWQNLRMGNGKKAEKIFYQLGVQSPVYYVGLGYVYLLFHNLQAAEENFKIALQAYPDLELIHVGLAQIYHEMGRETLAFAEYREILNKNPEHQWAKQRFVYLKNKKTEKVISEAEAALAAGHTEKSKESYLEALYYSPESTKAHLELSKIYRSEHKLQNALIHLKAASENEPANEKILKNYAETLYEAKQYTRSLEIFEKILELNPTNKNIVDQVESLKNKLGIYKPPSQYDSISSSEAISREETAALLAVKFKGIIDKVTGNPPIIIDISTSWASQFILQMTYLEIMDVYPNHTFQPKKVVTRAEIAKILFRFINYLQRKGFKFIEQIPTENIQISDVSPDNYYYQPIIRIISFNIMDLSPESMFNPELPVSGFEAIKLLNIILALIK